MTVERTNVSSGPLVGNGVTASFPFDFHAASADEVRVELSGTPVPKNLFTVAVNSDGTGSVNFFAAPMGSIVIYSDPRFTQEVDFEDQGPFYQSAVNEPIDRSAMRDLWLRDRVLRAPLLPIDIASFVGKFPTILPDGTWGYVDGVPGLPGPPGSSSSIFRPTLASFKAAPISDNASIYDSAVWVWMTGDYSTRTDLDVNVVKADSTALTVGAWVRMSSANITTRGRGTDPTVRSLADKVNDFVHVADHGARPGMGAAFARWNTDAIRRASAEITRRGGGTLLFDPGIYTVCYQTGFTSVGNFGPAPLDWQGMSGAVTILGNGAILRCAPGLMYGSFNPATGQPVNSFGQNPPVGNRASPCEGMLRWVNCPGDLRVQGLRMEGANTAFVHGGAWGDTGRQIPHNGFYIVNPTVTGRIDLSDCDGHQMGQDGLLLQLPAGSATARTPVTITRGYFTENGRQGCSLVGGRGVVFNSCHFNRTGRAGVLSAPAAGFDLEAEGANINRATEFNNCDFIDNAGNGMVADTGDSRDATFRLCRFIGTTIWSAFPNKPEMKFEDCLFVGALAGIYQDPSGADSNRFVRCRFTDDPTLSPTGAVYGARIIDAGESQTGALFDASVFDLKNGMGLPFHPGGARYNNSVLKQVGGLDAVLSAIWTGFNSITANNPNLVNSTYAGIVRLNGATVSPPLPRVAQRFPTVGGSGIAPGQTFTQRVYGFNGTTATAILLDAYGQGPNGDGVNAGPASARVGTRYSDGADIIVKNDHASAQFCAFGLVVL